MNAVRETLAKRYAKTLYKIHNYAVPTVLIEQLQTLAVFFSDHKEQLLTVCAGNIAKQQAHNLAQAIILKCAVANTLQPLMANLIQEHRTQLLNPIAEQLLVIKDRAAGCLSCKVYSAQPLQDNQKNTIILFIKREIKATSVVVTFIEKQELISGIRIVCDELMWERSVRKTLLLVKQHLLQQV